MRALSFCLRFPSFVQKRVDETKYTAEWVGVQVADLTPPENYSRFPPKNELSLVIALIALTSLKQTDREEDVLRRAQSETRNLGAVHFEKRAQKRNHGDSASQIS